MENLLTLQFFGPAFLERLFFVEYGGKLFAVMAFSIGDALRQVEQARYSAMWGGPF